MYSRRKINTRRCMCASRRRCVYGTRGQSFAGLIAFFVFLGLRKNRVVSRELNVFSSVAHNRSTARFGSTRRTMLDGVYLTEVDRWSLRSFPRYHLGKGHLESAIALWKRQVHNAHNGRVPSLAQCAHFNTTVLTVKRPTWARAIITIKRTTSMGKHV